jgi:hypothetical protein
MPFRLRGVLYCAVDFIADSRNAEWQAGRCVLRTARIRFALQIVRANFPSGSLR